MFIELNQYVYFYQIFLTQVYILLSIECELFCHLYTLHNRQRITTHCYIFMNITIGSPGEDYRGRFTINSHSGVVSTTQVLDREERQNYTLTIQARDYGPAPLNSFTRLQLVLLDQNDNVPSFSRKSYHASVSEGLPAGAEVLRVSAFDPDEGSNGDLTYSLTEDSSQGAFSVDPLSGVIRTTRSLDRESRAQYTLRAVATDGCTQGPLSSAVSMTIQVEDVNDNVPVCEQNPINAWVSMRTLPNQIIATVTATDGDQDENGSVQFILSDEENLFDVNVETGEISLRRRVRAGFSGRKLHVVVSDRGQPPLTSTCLVLIHLKGEHEGLHFINKEYNTTIKESSRAGMSSRLLFHFFFTTSVKSSSTTSSP